MTKKNPPQKLFGNGELPRLNGGQEVLFHLVCEAIWENKKVDYDDLMDVYQFEVQRSGNKSTLCWDEASGKHVWRSSPYADWELEQLMQSWLLRALGALIKKGYLTVVPRMELVRPKLND